MKLKDARHMSASPQEALPYRVVNAIEKGMSKLPEVVKLRQSKYLNNIVEQNHRGIKRLVKPGMGFGSFNTARKTIRGYEIINMLRKGQVLGVPTGAIKERIVFITQIFGVVA